MIVLHVWLRVIRVRFLLASVIAVSVGLSVHWWQFGTLNVVDAIIVMAGILALHASIDLLNDYWDFKRGIDTVTKQTGMSGGTGVLPEGLLDPVSVYRAGIAFLLVGTAIGIYFVVVNGWIIAILLGFAVIAVYFYSTRIVDSGLAEVFVAVKGAMIVLGTGFIQSDTLTPESVLAGIIVGALSSLVLFIASFPDYDADKARGRKTLVIIAGKKHAVKLYWAFPIISYSLMLYCVLTGLFPALALIILLPAPLAVQAGIGLGKNYDNVDGLLPFMTKTLLFSRITGALLVASFAIGL